MVTIPKCWWRFRETESFTDFWSKLKKTPIMEIHSCSCIGRLNTVKLSILHKTIYRFNIISITIPGTYIYIVLYIYINFYWIDQLDGNSCALEGTTHAPQPSSRELCWAEPTNFSTPPHKRPGPGVGQRGKCHWNQRLLIGWPRAKPACSNCFVWPKVN